MDDVNLTDTNQLTLWTYDCMHCGDPVEFDVYHIWVSQDDGSRICRGTGWLKPHRVAGQAGS